MFKFVKRYVPAQRSSSPSNRVQSPLQIEQLEQRQMLSGDFALAMSFGGINSDVAEDIVTDSADNVYVTGRFDGTVDFDPGAGVTNLTSTGSDVFLAKYSSAGALVWAQHIDTGASAQIFRVAVDGSGNVYSLLNSKGSASYNSGATTVTGAGDQDGYISKFDSAGNLVWAKSVGSAAYGLVESINSDSAGNVYLGGYFYNTVDFDDGPGVTNLSSLGNNDGFVMKWNTDGDFQWAGSIGGSSYDFIKGVDTDSSGNVYITGSFNQTADLDPTSGTANFTSSVGADAYVTKLNSSGAFQWARVFAGAGQKYPYAIEVDSAGNVYTTGSFQFTADFDPGAGVANLTSVGNLNAYLAKLDTNGNYVWAKNIIAGGDSYGNDIALDASGNVFVAGAFNGTADFDPGAGIQSHVSQGWDVFVSVLDGSGDLDWATPLGGTDTDWGHGVAVDSAGNTWATGYFTGTADFDPGANQANLTSAGSNDIFLVKLGDGAAAPTAELSLAAASNPTAEGTNGSTPTTYEFNVTRSVNTTGTSSVDWAVSSANMTADDFVGAVMPGGTVSFADGETSKTISVSVLADAVFESDESFLVTISNATSATISTATAAGVVNNDDAQLNIAAVGSNSTDEGTDASPNSYSFNVTRSGSTSGTASVDWAVTSSTMSTDDFDGGVLPSGTINFADGESTRTITIDVLADSTVESNESFVVTISNASSAAIGTAAATGTVNNDDTTLAISAAGSNPTDEGTASSATAYNFTITRSGDTRGTESVEWAVTSSTMLAGDFVGGALPAGTVNFADGESSKTVAVNVLADSTVETDEAFVITVSNASSATIVTATAAGVVANDDETLSITASGSNPDVEGTDATSTAYEFTIARTGDTRGASSVDWTVSSSSMDASDFVGGVLPSGTASFADGETSKTITINVIADSTVESDESFTITLTDVVSATIGTSTVTGTVNNDDTALTIAASGSNSTDEGTDVAATAYSFTVTRSGDISGNESVDWTASSTSMTADDFVGGVIPDGTVTFADGETTKTITVSVLADTSVESNESFVVTLSNASSANIETATANGVVDNDDTELSVAAAGSNPTDEGTDSTPTSYQFTVTRTGDTRGTETVDWNVTSTNMNADDFDGGVLPTGTVTFADGESSKVIAVVVAADSVLETDEAFAVTLSNSSSATIVTATASGNAANDDEVLSIAAGLNPTAEGSDAASTSYSFTVTRAGDTRGGSSVDWSVTSASMNVSDFVGGVLPGGTVSFADGETSKTITVNVIADSSVESDESFTVTLSNANSANIGTSTALGTVDNDDTVLTIAASGSNSSDEGTDAVSTDYSFTITRSGDLTGTESVDWAVSSTDMFADDFAGGVIPAGTVTFADGETTKTIAVDVLADSAVESNESFVVTLSNASSANIETATANAVVDNDDTELSIAAEGSNPTDEGTDATPTAYRFTVSRTGDTRGTETVDWQVTATKMAADDFDGGVLPSGTITFADGETSKTITVNVAADSILESDEAFAVTLSNASSATIITATAAGAVANDDETLSIIASGSNPSAEGSDTVSTTYSFAVSRTGDTRGPASVDWSVSSTDMTADDFAGSVIPGGTVNFADGETEKTITVDVLADKAVESDESFVVTLSSANSATIATAVAAGQVDNDDTSLSIAASASNSKFEGTGATPTRYEFTVTRSGLLTGQTTVDWTLATTMTADDFADGSLPGGTITFADGQTSKTITVDVAADNIVERNESFVVRLSNSGEANIVGGDAKGLVGNDAGDNSFVGSSASDRFDFRVRNNGFLVRFNSATYLLHRTSVNQVSFTGVAGSRVTVVGSGENETAVLGFGSLSFGSDSYAFVASGATHFTVNAGYGTDSAILNGTTGNDRLSGNTSMARMSGSGYSMSASGFDSNVVNASTGNDTATLRGTSGNDRLEAHADHATLTGRGLDYRVNGFNRVTVQGDRGFDTALLYDSTGNDVFSGVEGNSSLRGLGFYNAARSFERVKVRATTGNDRATINDSSRDDQFYTTGRASLLKSRTYSIQTVNFDSATIKLGSRGNDTASFKDSIGNDTFVAGANTATLSGNGYSYRVSGFKKVTASASKGNDTAILHGTDGSETFTAGAEKVTLRGRGVDILVSGFDSVTAKGGKGSDRALLYGSGGKDVFVGQADSSSLTGTSSIYVAEGFESVTAIAYRGEGEAVFHDSSGDDKFISINTGRGFSGSMRGPGYTIRTLGFKTLTANASAGRDTADISGSGRASRLVSTGGSASLISRGYSTVVNGFDSLTASAKSRFDVAVLRGTEGDDRFVVRDFVSTLTGDEYNVTTRAFFKTTALGGAGNDQAVFHGTRYADVYTAKGTRATSSIGKYSWTASGFRSVNAIANNAGDTATLNDTTGNDVFVAGQKVSRLTGRNYSNSASGFRAVNAYSTAGNDRAVFYDSAARETFTASPAQAQLVGKGFRNTAFGFASVAATSTGGNDVARLFDSKGNDTFKRRSNASVLSGTGFSMTVRGFSRVDVFATRGGRDTAYLYDSKGNDYLQTSQRKSLIRADGRTDIANGFDRVVAYATSGGSDLAVMKESAGRDTLIARGNSARVQGPGFQAEAIAFDTVTAVGSDRTRDRVIQRGGISYRLINRNW